MKGLIFFCTSWLLLVGLGLMFVGVRADDLSSIPSEPAEQFEALLLEERVVEALQAGDRLDGAIRQIVRDEIAKQAAARK